MRPLLSAAQVVNHTYTIGRLLGKGSFGEVYLATHRYLGVQALKALRADESTTFNDLLSEARLLVDLTHPHIVRVYDANVCKALDEPFAFVTMEFAAGGTLADLAESRIRLSDPVVHSIGIQIASALSETHSRNPPLLHRDIKPSNILVVDSKSTSPVVKLSDYGMASTLDPETRLTRSAGTIAFAPPEMAWGILDERGDIYSLGVTLYRLLTGLHPYPLTSPEEMSATREFRQALSKGRKQIASPTRMLMRAENDLDRVIMQCLEFDLFSRFKNGTDLLKALTGVRLPSADDS